MDKVSGSPSWSSVVMPSPMTLSPKKDTTLEYATLYQFPYSLELPLVARVKSTLFQLPDAEVESGLIVHTLKSGSSRSRMLLGLRRTFSRELRGLGAGCWASAAVTSELAKTASRKCTMVEAEDTGSK